MKIIEQIKFPIKKEMDLFEEKFSELMISDVFTIELLLCCSKKRKQMTNVCFFNS